MAETLQVVSPAPLWDSVTNVLLPPFELIVTIESPFTPRLLFAGGKRAAIDVALFNLAVDAPKPPRDSSSAAICIIEESYGAVL